MMTPQRVINVSDESDMEMEIDIVGTQPISQLAIPTSIVSTQAVPDPAKSGSMDTAVPITTTVMITSTTTTVPTIITPITTTTADTTTTTARNMEDATHTTTKMAAAANQQERQPSEDFELIEREISPTFSPAFSPTPSNISSITDEPAHSEDRQTPSTCATDSPPLKLRRSARIAQKNTPQLRTQPVETKEKANDSNMDNCDHIDTTEQVNPQAAAKSNATDSEDRAASIQAGTATQSTNNQRPKAIYITGYDAIQTLSTEIYNVLGHSDFLTRPTQNGIRVRCNDHESYNKLLQYFNTTNMETYTHQPESERGSRFFIRHLHRTTSFEWIRTELEKIGYKVRYVSSVTNRNTGMTTAFWVELETTPDVSTILNVKRLGCQIVEIEKLKNPVAVVQCHRCQQHGHTKNYCRRPYACVKCAGSHSTPDCRKTSQQPPKCVNCGAAHAANYKGCISYKEALKRLKVQQPQPQRLAYHRPTQTSRESSPGPSSSTHRHFSGVERRHLSNELTSIIENINSPLPGYSLNRFLPPGRQSPRPVPERYQRLLSTDQQRHHQERRQRRQQQRLPPSTSTRRTSQEPSALPPQSPLLEPTPVQPNLQSIAKDVNVLKQIVEPLMSIMTEVFRQQLDQ